MELLLVVALLSILVSVVFPRLKGSVRAAGLEEGAQEVAELVRFSRAEALRRRLRVRFDMDAQGRKYWIMVQDGQASHHEQFTSFGDPFLDARRALPRGVRIARIREGEAITRARSVVFRPDGVSAPYTLELTDEMDRRARVKVGPWFDEVSVSIGEAKV